MAVALQHLGAEISADKVCRLPVDSEPSRFLGREQGRAVPFPHADIVRVHRKPDNLESTGAKPFENRGMLGGELHSRPSIAGRIGFGETPSTRRHNDNSRLTQAAEEEMAPDSSCRKTSRSAAANSWSPTWLLRNWTRK